MQIENIQLKTQGITSNQLVKKFSNTTGKKENMILIIGAIIVVLGGVGTGWLLSGRAKGTSESAAPGAKQTQNEAGLADEKTFRDSAEGILEEGGIAGEGTHHLKRDSDASQYVYLTSTVIDLQSFVGKKVQVWGETITGKKAGWLMDVGKIKVIQ
ncbi:MAG TPA: hypothetical protein VJ399_02165 [Patescibacteria group bacterium]|nr:hypothetical protein [Patescibacteria group bacterium]